MTTRGFINFLSIFVLCTTVAACQDTSIDNYETKTLDEGMIIDVLKQYQNSRNIFDVNLYLDCLHPNGKYSFMGAHILQKYELERKLPRFWKRLQLKDATVYPIMRESITGDFFDIWKFYNIKLSLNDDTAKVTTICKSSWICKQSHFITLLKENGNWKISETAWKHF